MGLGRGVVKTMRKVSAISDTRLHQDHRHCAICQAGPFSTLEEMYDHIDAHPERLNGSGVQKDGGWIVLYEPSDYYREHPTELPESLAHLLSIDEQARVLGIDDHEHKLEFTDLAKLRRVQLTLAGPKREAGGHFLAVKRSEWRSKKVCSSCTITTL